MFVPQASKIETLSNDLNLVRFWAIWQKWVNYFWFNVSILEDVSLAETIVWCKDINQTISIFQCSKNDGNPTHVTKCKVAVNMVDANNLMKKYGCTLKLDNYKLIVSLTAHDWQKWKGIPYVSPQ